MRWPWQPKLAETTVPPTPAPKRTPLRELGATGTVYFAGVIADEYNSNLAGAKGIETYDKMRRSDAQIQAVLWICELPLRSATWTVEPASESAQDVEIAKAVQSNLIEGMSITWDDFLRHALLMLAYGHSVFEKVLERRDGKIIYRKLAPRLPVSIAKWDMERDGGLKGVEQLVWTGTAYERPYIPVDKLLVFSYRKEGANWMGQSLLRAAYKHWYYKDQFYRIDAIANERHGVGVPYVKMSADATEADYTEAAAILAALHAHEQASVVGKPSWDEFSIIGMGAAGGGTLKSTMESINHHDVMIARSVLAQFLNLGSGDTGSFALSKDQSSFFLLALRALANQICDTVNEYAIKPLVDLNWSVKAYPKLVCTKLESRDLTAYGSAVKALIDAGAIVVDEGLRATLRDMYGLPEENPEEIAAQQQAQAEALATAKAALQQQGQPPEGQAAGDAQQGGKSGPVISEDTSGEDKVPADKGKDQKLSDHHAHAHRLSDGPFWRELRASEDRATMEGLRDTLEQGRQAYVAAAKTVVSRQMDRLIELVLPAIEAKDAAKAGNLTVPYKAELADALAVVLQRLYVEGKGSVGLERMAKTQLPQPASFALVDPELLAEEFLRAKAKSAANILAVRLLAALTWEALDQIKDGEAEEPALRSVLEMLSEKNLQDMANTSVPEAANLGRRDAVTEIADEIDHAEYSAILDSNVCGVCRDLDGLEVTLDDPRYEQYMPPNPECEGGDRCRCVWVLVFKSETKAVR
ncbi:MAG: phage portal protein family protein [Anaerolineae bacterium]